MQAKQALEALAAAVSRKDCAEFNAKYFEFLMQFADFRNSLASNNTPEDSKFTPNNPTFGGKAGFALAGGRSTAEVPAHVKERAATLLTNAKAAYSIFAGMPLKERLEFLALLEKAVSRHQDEITLTIAADTGKPVINAEAEMDKGGKWFADAYKKSWNQLGEEPNGDKTKSIEPLGVVQIIGTYNYPYALAIGGIIGALTAGNSIIITPSSKAPNWVFPFIQAAKEAVAEFIASPRCTLTQEQQETLKSYLIQYNIGVNKSLTDEVDLVHFVGSNTVGEAIGESRTKKHKKSILELGGNSVVVVMESALAVAGNKGAKGIAGKIFDGFAPATGQRCTAPRLIFLQGTTDEVAGELATLCRNETQTHALTGKPCNPFKKDAAMGPLVDANARKRMEQAVTLAAEVGAPVNGGKAENTKVLIDDTITPGGSCWVNPIVIDWTRTELSKLNASQKDTLKDLLTHETFGPLVHVVKKISSIAEATLEANKWDKYKLAAAVFTGTPEDTQQFQLATSITSVTENTGPKDQSPQGPHGHPWLDVIGGESHYLLYTRQFVVKSSDSLKRDAQHRLELA